MSMLKRINELSEMFADDINATRLLTSVEVAVENYRSIVSRFVSAVNNAAYRMSEERLIDFTSDLDRRRKGAHSSLCDSIVAAQRYLVKHYREELPLGGLFSVGENVLRNLSRKGATDPFFRQVVEDLALEGL